MKVMIKSVAYTVFSIMMMLQVAPAMAQNNSSAAEKEIAYRNVVFQRSEKIVKGLNLADSVQALKVTKVVAKQYQDLNDIYVLRDNNKATIKAEAGNDKEAVAAKLKKVEDQTTTSIDKLHPKYLKNLAKAGLNPVQINQVKDGMTYNVLNVTYTEAQKTQIMAWLTEAREHSMDAESSEKKHAWFGKYKGRINNYLSSQGIDMKKEEAAWMARLKEAKAAQQQ
jgi:hypothetical protein